VWVSRERFIDVLDAIAGRDDVRITFDDGNASDVEHALPALRERRLAASFFVVADRVGEPGFLDEAGVRALASSGMTVGCHGLHHRPFRSIGDRALRDELLDAKRSLEAIVGGPVQVAACPFGSYDRRVLGTLRRCGFRTVYTSDRGTARSHAWIQARNTVHRGDRPDLLERIVSDERPPHRAWRRGAERAVKRWR